MFRGCRRGLVRFVDAVLKAVLQRILPINVRQAHQTRDKAGVYPVAFSRTWLLSSTAATKTGKQGNRPC